MRALQNSAASPRSEKRRTVELLIAFATVVSLVCFADGWFFRNGYILYYGDAQAHLNISRSLIDSRTPGYDQIGTVWLPVLHLLCLPLVGNDWLWSTGLAGTVPVSCCLVFAAILLFVTAREVYTSSLAGFVVLGCLVLNPNVLYLAAIPMTECVFLAGLALLLFAAQGRLMWLGIIACWFMCLTRYDGWFLLPFAAAWFAYKSARRRLLVFVAFAAIASLAPIYWIAHNWYETSNPLDFFNGPYSPKAIQGDRPYPGLHNWPQAIHYYVKAGQLCTGWPLLLLGVVGFLCLSNARMLLPASFLMLTPLFYMLSLHSSANPIFVPQLWPHGYYNSRYGIAVVVWAAFAAGAIVTVIPRRWRKASIAVLAVAILPWLFSSREDWIVWKESDVNSRSRLAWTRAAVSYLQQNYRTGQGITAAFGDLTGIFCHGRIPIAEVLHEGNGPLWWATNLRPDLVHTEVWAIGQAKAFGPEYTLVRDIRVQGAPPLLIYKRHH